MHRPRGRPPDISVAVDQCHPSARVCEEAATNVRRVPELAALQGLRRALLEFPHWKTFLAAQWDGLAAADFFSVEVLTMRGLVRYVVFFVMMVKTRSVAIAGITRQPDETWMTQVARNPRPATRTRPRRPNRGLFLPASSLIVVLTTVGCLSNTAESTCAFSPSRRCGRQTLGADV